MGGNTYNVATENFMASPKINASNLSLLGQFSEEELLRSVDPNQGAMSASISRVDRNISLRSKSLDFGIRTAAHEYTHALSQTSMHFAGIDELFYKNEMAERASDQFINFDARKGVDSVGPNGEKLLKVGDEAYNISRYSKHIEHLISAEYLMLATEEAVAETGSNLITRLAYGDSHLVSMADSGYAQFGRSSL
jgi:hypothetical protein